MVKISVCAITETEDDDWKKNYSTV